MLTQEEIDKVASHFFSPNVILSLCYERARLAACERATARISEYLHTSLVCNTRGLAPAQAFFCTMVYAEYAYSITLLFGSAKSTSFCRRFVTFRLHLSKCQGSCLFHVATTKREQIIRMYSRRNCGSVLAFMQAHCPFRSCVQNWDTPFTGCSHPKNR